MPNPAETILQKHVLPTELSSADIRDFWSREMRERAFFSARTTEAGYLARLQEVCARVANGEMNNADARMLLQQHLDSIGYDPEAEGDTGLRNKASARRLNLIVDTQRKMARSAAQMAEQTPAELELYPAWRLERYGARMVPRQDWADRWVAAGQSVGWDGASQRTLVALKSSPIWAALGKGVGGYKDTLGNPYPPFAFGSGLNWSPVSREEAVSLGIIEPDETATAPDASLRPGQTEIRDAIDRLGPDFQDELEKELLG